MIFNRGVLCWFIAYDYITMHGSNIKFTKKTVSFWSLWNYTVAQGWRIFMRARVQIVYNFRKKKKIFRVPVEILMNQNTVLEFHIIIINYWVIVNVYYNFNCIINSWYSYIIFLIKASPEDCDKEENMVVTVLLLFAVWKEDFKFHVFAQPPSDRRPNDKYPVKTSYRSDLCKNVSL